MAFLTTSRRFIVALAFALFALQSAGVAHGYAYGDDPHEHGGQVCALALVAPDGDVLLPAPVTIAPAVQIFTPAAYSPAVKAAPAAIYAPRGPPGRGPPARSL